LNGSRVFRKAQSLSPGAQMPAPTPETPPLSRAGRRVADAIMATAKFKATVDGSRYVRQFEVHGIEVIEWISAEQFAEFESEKK
jgi:hypothetical protein